VHGANGYLVDRFLQDVSDRRMDAYGGSVENRVRFGTEVVDAVVGARRATIRLSPRSLFQDMRMEDPVPMFARLVESLLTLRRFQLHPRTGAPREW